MEVDMNLCLERRICTQDESTLRTKIIILIHAERVRKAVHVEEREEVDQTGVLRKDLWDLPCDIWVQIAQLCPLTFTSAWVQCPFADWLSSPSDRFPTTYEHFVRELRGLEAQVRAEHHSELQPKNDWEVEECIQNEIFARFRFEADFSKQLTYVFKELDLARRNDFAYDLFSPSSLQKIKPLGCVREGWPVDKAPLFACPQVGFDMDAHDKDANVVGLCFFTLDGLFSVDWDLSCCSEERSGLHLRPGGAAQPVCDDEKVFHRGLDEILVLAADLGIEVAPSLEAQLRRGAQARYEEHALEEGAAKREDLHALRSFESDLLACTDPRLQGLEQYSRRQILNFNDSDDDIVAQLKAFEAAVVDAGNDPADFRMLLSFLG